MRKVTKKIMSLVLMASMALTGITSVVNAAPQRPDTGNLYIHRFAIDDIANAGLPNDGTEASVPDGAEALEGISFKIYQVDTSANYPADGAVTVNSMADTTSFTDSTGKSFNVTLKDTRVTNADGLAESENLAKGLYLVVEQETDKVATPSAPYIVSVPMTNASGDGWITDVHTYPKNGDINVSKTVSNASASVGEVITWTINSTAGSTVEDAKKFDIIDQLDSALTYVDNTVIVKGIGTDGTETDIDASNYTVDVNEDNKMTISFTGAGREILKNHASIKITFDTVVNQKILSKETHSLGNQASLEFTNKYGQDKDRTSSTVKVHAASIKVVKTNTEGAVLPSAKFQIATSAENAKNGRFLRLGADGKVVDFGGDGYDGASVWELTTDAKGVAIFEGLKDIDGNTYQTYYVMETAAPEGYSLVGKPIEATFTAANSTEEGAYTMTVNVVDDKKPILPMTGGTGTWMFAATGIALIAIAGLLAILGKKRNAATTK